jgi:membrane-bound ClpP family serine protease
MSVLVVIILILLGLVLIILEILVIPGAVAGIIGVLSVAGGVYLSYSNYGTAAGNYTLLGTVVLAIASIVYAFKSKTWKGAMLQTEIDGKMNVTETKFHPGDTGITISRLAPMGKVSVNDTIIEAKSEAMFIDQETEIEVVRVLDNMLIVKPKK